MINKALKELFNDLDNQVSEMDVLFWIRGMKKIPWTCAGLSGAFSDRSIFPGLTQLNQATCLPSGRNSAQFRQQSNGC